MVAARQRHASREKHQDLDFIIGQLDWDKNVDTHFKDVHSEPTATRPAAAKA
ncbi:MAG: hypothetical protein U0892_03595 [Pirellulales bacterium]